MSKNKVPFEEATYLVAKRQVWLQRGVAHVPRSKLVSLVQQRFRHHLGAELAKTFHMSQHIRNDKRLNPILTTLSKHNADQVYKPGVRHGYLAKEHIPMLSQRSFPLCMQVLHTSLKSESHLKHGGRMQYGLFLKGIGLPLSEALDFWRSSFSRRTPSDKFGKEYAYNIRHNYGKEGKRTQYTPYGWYCVYHYVSVVISFICLLNLTV